MSDTTRVVILGGGGVVGIAWEIGVLAGLKEAGIDLAQHTDALIGTSAGSFAATLIASTADLEERYQAQFGPAENEVSATMAPEVQQKYQEAYMANYGQAIPLAKAFGDIAKTAETISTDLRTSVVATRLGINDWPDNDLLRMTSIDADTGELVLLDRHSGLSIVEAASATGAVPGIWPMVVAGGRNWIDGGMISAANAQLGSGYDRVLVIAPVAETNGGFDSVEAAAEKLRASATVVTITLDDQAKETIGTNFLNPEFRAIGAEAGRAHALRAADEVRATWLA
ncbi:patatin-like phospholipase family protein [Subtercola endophyticus]|uniref:patatin-like phospholipase family protein n=1 Tax=Subtercola endophyticus TaxID=2895559 RepID=UPI001E4C227E|nr:patatin-like phospholipase family protein [Subtercola endophyticus]UFS58765.1 patatin-like phospholipase family protein [Subtercola endophyticus]